MNIGMMALMALISTLTLLILALRVVRWKILIRYHWVADIVFTLALFVLLQGTITGMIIAIISGLIFSIILSVGKMFTPHENKQQTRAARSH